MNCKKARRLLPLIIGSEIPQSRISAIKAHLEECPECRKKYDSYVKSLKKTKEWLEEDRKDWEEKEWQAVIRRAVKEEKPEVSPLIPWPFKKAWAYTLMAVFVLALTLLIIWPFFSTEEMGAGSKMLAESQTRLFESVGDKPEQDVISMTIVSKETGLKIVWFFNKNFELEEKR